jgi:hypothetical protein
MPSAPETVPKPPENANPRRRAVRRLSRAWDKKRRASLESSPRRTRDDLSLGALLLSGLTLSADEGPALDVLGAVHEQLEGLTLTREPDSDLIHVSLAQVMLLANQVEVARELVRRQAI